MEEYIKLIMRYFVLNHAYESIKLNMEMKAMESARRDEEFNTEEFREAYTIVANALDATILEMAPYAGLEELLGTVTRSINKQA